MQVEREEKVGRDKPEHPVTNQVIFVDAVGWKR